MWLVLIPFFFGRYCKVPRPKIDASSSSSSQINPDQFRSAKGPDRGSRLRARLPNLASFTLASFKHQAA